MYDIRQKNKNSKGYRGKINIKIQKATKENELHVQ